jgi:hypothetical protein
MMIVCLTRWYSQLDIDGAAVARNDTTLNKRPPIGVVVYKT